MNKNNALIVAALGSATLFGGCDTSYRGQDTNLDSRVASPDAVVTSIQPVIFIVPTQDDMYCQPTPEELRKRNAYFRGPNTKSLVLYDLNNWNAEPPQRNPTPSRGRDFASERNASRSYERNQNLALRNHVNGRS